MDAQLIIDQPAAGAWNMAVDEALLRWADETGGTALRFYQWSEPTLSLGYFQRYRDRRWHTASVGIAAVRRTTGGGAIVHDRELTYSFVAPLADRFSGAAQTFVAQVHEALLAALRLHGLAASLCGAAQHRSEPQPFLCFLRREKLDVVVGDHKVAGSAQRRRRAALLQHGSVLLAQSRHAPELPGINDLARAPLSAADLVASWAAHLATARSLHFAESSLTDQQRHWALEIEHQRYADQAWTERR